LFPLKNATVSDHQLKGPNLNCKGAQMNNPRLTMFMSILSQRVILQGLSNTYLINTAQIIQISSSCR